MPDAIGQDQSQSQLPIQKLSATGIGHLTNWAEPATPSQISATNPFGKSRLHPINFALTIGAMEESPQTLQPGQIIARGVARHLRQLDFVPLLEFVPARGLRVDVIALGPKGEIWIIECKSSREDFQTDHKWQGYLEFSDRFFFAVPAEFPTEILPDEHGLIFADGYGAEIIRDAPETPLNAARRKKITLKFARNAADRLQSYTDPRL